MSKKTKPAQSMGSPTGYLPEETQTAIEAAALQAENETPTASQETDPAEVNALRQEVEKLRAQIAKAPASLEDQINYFKRKQELITRLNGISNSIFLLEKHSEEVIKEAEEDTFASEIYALKLTAKKGYSSEEDVFKFRNPGVIAELISFVLARMQEKKEAIEEEIAA